MKGPEHFARHPACTCPDLTFASLASGEPNRAACRTRAYPIDPHPVLSGDDVRQLLEAFRATPE